MCIRDRYTPGARQNLTPMDLVPVLKAYEVIMATAGRKIDPTRFVTSSNIVWKDVRVWENSWMPHTDFDLVCNLWLCNYEGGTAIYKYKGFLNSKDITLKLNTPISASLFYPDKNSTDETVSMLLMPIRLNE